MGRRPLMENDRHRVRRRHRPAKRPNLPQPDGLRSIVGSIVRYPIIGGSVGPFAAVISMFIIFMFSVAFQEILPVNKPSPGFFIGGALLSGVVGLFSGAFFGGLLGIIFDRPLGGVIGGVVGEVFPAVWMSPMMLFS